MSKKYNTFGLIRANNVTKVYDYVKYQGYIFYDIKKTPKIFPEFSVYYVIKFTERLLASEPLFASFLQ